MAERKPNLDYICEAVFYDGTPILSEPSSWGVRLILPILGGTVKGPKLNGTIRPFGADWGVLRGDNCIEVDVRTIVDTDDGASIHIYYHGIIPMTQSEVDQFVSGELPSGLNIYVTPRFETSHQNYEWLNRIQAVGLGDVEQEGDRLKVTYAWYALTA